MSESIVRSRSWKKGSAKESVYFTLNIVEHTVENRKHYSVRIMKNRVETILGWFTDINTIDLIFEFSFNNISDLLNQRLFLSDFIKTCNYNQKVRKDHANEITFLMKAPKLKLSSIYGK